MLVYAVVSFQRRFIELGMLRAIGLSVGQMAMYLAREETDASLPQIGEALGNRDHTTVMHGWEKISSRIEGDDRLRREMLSIREELYS